MTLGRGGRLRPWGAATVRFDPKIRTTLPGAAMTENCGWVEVAGAHRAETVALPRFDRGVTMARGEEAGVGSVSRSQLLRL